MKLGIVSVFISLLALSSSASAYDCSTESKGYHFYSDDSQEAIRQCQAHPSTNNNECELNLSCIVGSVPAPPTFPTPPVDNSFACRTDSKGYNFYGDTPSEAINQCKAHSSTNNTECEQNLSCATGVPTVPTPPVIDTGYACHTDSKNYDFYGTTASSAVSQCQAHPSTSNTECEKNVRCEGSSSATNCTANSKGYTFYGATPAEAINQCQAHPSTSNRECEQSLVCR
jgi:hypothetical protein